MLVDNRIHVGMAEIQVARVPTVFTALGLGSCIGLCAYDPNAKVAGMIHVMLPEAFKNRPIDKVGKFADTGIPELLALLEQHGATRRRLVTAYAGGASVFQFGSGSSGSIDIGARNSAAVLQMVKALSLPVLATDTGGTCGRTMVFDSSTGLVTVKSVRTGETELCVMR